MCDKNKPFYRKYASNRTFCGSDENSTGPSESDSAVEFVMDNGNKWFLRGILASKSNKSNPNVTTIFTDISYFYDWITSNIGA